MRRRQDRTSLRPLWVPEETMRPSDAEKWVALSETNDDVADMLTFLSREANWFDLYKAHEMVTKLIGGQRQMLWQAPRAWVQEEKDDQFYFTANWYRHSSAAKKAKVNKPLVLMDLKAAYKYIRDLVRRVLAD